MSKQDDDLPLVHARQYASEIWVEDISGDRLTVCLTDKDGYEIVSDADYLSFDRETFTQLAEALRRLARGVPVKG